MFAERFSRAIDKIIAEAFQRNQLQAYKNRIVIVASKPVPLSKFETHVEKIVKKIVANPQLTKTIHCRNSYERRIAHETAERNGLHHEKVQTNNIIKKRVDPMYEKTTEGYRRRYCISSWDRRQYEEPVYGVEISAPSEKKTERQMCKKMATEFLNSMMPSDPVSIITKYIKG